MEKHITLVGVLNIVYRSLILLLALIVIIIGFGIGGLFDTLIRTGSMRAEDVPIELINIVPFIVVIIGLLMSIVSVLGIIGGAGVLKKKEWGRILLLVVSFLNLLHVPLGTALGAYSIWVLMSTETITAFNPKHDAPAAANIS